MRKFRLRQNLLASMARASFIVLAQSALPGVIMPQLTIEASGVHVIAPTPFDEKGALDLASTSRMVERYIGMGATGLTILGMMGEAPKLSTSESLRFVKEVLA